MLKGTVSRSAHAQLISQKIVISETKWHRQAAGRALVLMVVAETTLAIKEFFGYFYLYIIHL